eukprot:TRINITY_DN56900_c0_g1_i1.p1 TRINITY_DN56900_c0_g1~~TRINITY_DN56900_c0_g1_i1.p1  ORF type:complete len:905 (+),score=145.73 TRINITY_DN56900_c0_g1_i1:84-2717(+)
MVVQRRRLGRLRASGRCWSSNERDLSSPISPRHRSRCRRTTARGVDWRGGKCVSLVMAAVLSAAVGPCAAGMEYASTYSFMADRTTCDGQCSWCREAKVHHHWADIRSKLGQWVYRDLRKDEERGDHKLKVEGGSLAVSGLRAADLQLMELQNMITYSWDVNHKFDCVVGIIALRLLTYGYTNPMQFTHPNVDVLDWLDTFNQHTGILDFLTSSWAEVIAGGWPIFRELLLVSRKVVDRLLEEGSWPRMQERHNECDELDTEADILYRDKVVDALNGNAWPLAGTHFRALSTGIRCPIGVAVSLLSLALDMVHKRGSYQGSLKDTDNLVYALISNAQEAVAAYSRTKSNWSPFFDMLTTKWPLWELLSELSCVDSGRACATRSAWQCYDLLGRMEVPCPHVRAMASQNFVACGEHDICDRPAGLDPETWCIPFDRRPDLPRTAWLLLLGHDDEERVCAQCGQDGVLRTIFEHIGFREPVASNATAAAALSAAGASTEPEGSSPSLARVVPPFYVEFGARKPHMLNSAALRELCGWDGLLMDGQPGETPHGGCPTCPGVDTLVRKEFVTAENVVDLFKKHDVPRDFDLLTIDTDYNDYWLWRALLEDGHFRPRVVAVDFNPDFGLDEAKVVEYVADAEWDGTKYTVGSLLAYALMARHFDYTFAYALEMGAHAFFIRDDLLADHDRDLPLRAALKASHPPDKQRRKFRDVLYDFVPRNRTSRGFPWGVSSPSDDEAASSGSDAKTPWIARTVATGDPAVGSSTSASGPSSSSATDAELSELRQQVSALVGEIRKLRNSGQVGPTSVGNPLGAIASAAATIGSGRLPGASTAVAATDARGGGASSNGDAGGDRVSVPSRVVSAATSFYEEVQRQRSEAG